MAAKLNPSKRVLLITGGRFIVLSSGGVAILRHGNRYFKDGAWFERPVGIQGFDSYDIAVEWAVLLQMYGRVEMPVDEVRFKGPRTTYRIAPHASVEKARAALATQYKAIPAFEVSGGRP